MATPDMGLDLPVPGVTTGPTWANKLNAALTTVDSHDHSSGKGAPVHIEDIVGAGTMAQQNAASVLITGGSIAVSADPTTPLQVATKQYVDATAGGAITSLTGDVVATGPGAASAGLVNIPANTPAIFLRFTGIAGPGTPASGKGNAYYDQTGKVLALVNDAGVVSHTVRTKASTTHQFLTAIADDGTVSAAQPAASDITGLASIATSGSASDLITGTLPAGRFPALTGDVTTVAGSLATTLAASGVTAATYGDASHVPQVTFDAKGRATSASSVAIAIAAGAVSGLAPIATSGSATDLGVGTLPAGRLPAFTGDVTTSAGSSVTTLARLPNDVPMVGDLLASIMAAPSTPASGKARIYVDSTAKTLSVINSDGNISHTVFSQAPVTSRYVVGIDDNGVIETGSVSVTDISGATTAGQAMLTAASATAQAELLAPSIASWGRGLVHNTSVPPSGSWTPDGYTSTTGFVSHETIGQYQIHGLTGGTDGRIVVIYCATSSGLGLNREDAAATAADRFYSPACSIQAGQAAILRYSGALSRWVTIAAPAIYPASGGPNFAEVQFNYFGSAFAASPGIYGSTLMVLDTFDTLQMGAVQLAARLQQKLGSSTASANDLTLPGHNTAVNGSSSSSGGGNTYPITGSTTINRLDASGWQSGSRVRLIFGAATTVTHHGASASGTLYPFDLSGGVDFLTAAGDQLDLVFDGAYWQEAGRRAA